METAKSPLCKIDGVVFDFDGVLADSMPIQEEVWLQALHNAVPQPRREVEERLVENLYSGESGDSMLSNLELDERLSKALRREKDRLWTRARERVSLFPGAAAVVRGLFQSLPLAIATSSQREYVEGILRRENLRECFEVVRTSADVGRGKPAPDLLLEVSEQLGIPVERLLMVGDTRMDPRMSESAGSPFLMMATSKSQRSLRGVDSVRDWDELAELVGGRLPLPHGV